MLRDSAVAKVFYGKHFYPGVAEYKNTSTRVLLKEDAIRRMNPTFQGKPVFVGHVGDEIDKMSLDEIKKISVGEVIRSFYNDADGDTWVEFIIDSQEGLDAIARGWKLSNAYEKDTSDPRHGLWNGVDYDEEILSGTFHHLGIVQNPRYDGMILTPEQFKNYNEQKKAELTRLQNSLEKSQEKPMAFNFFKKAKVENGIDLEGLSVQLPKTQREVALVDLIQEADVELKEITDQVIMVNEEKDERMTIAEAVNEIKMLRNKCNEYEEELKNKKNEEDKKEEDKKENEEEEKKEENKCNEEEKKDEDKKENEEDKKDEDKKENEEDEKEDDKKENEDESEKKVEEAKEKTEEKIEKNFLNELLNANKICDNPAGENILLPSDRAALGRKYY